LAKHVPAENVAENPSLGVRLDPIWKAIPPLDSDASFGHAYGILVLVASCRLASAFSRFATGVRHDSKRPIVMNELTTTAPHDSFQKDANPKLSILLVNYNGKRYLGPCIESILNFAPKGTQVILEDNASSDGSTNFVVRDYPWVEIVRSELNLGFAAGNNLASNMARGKFLLLLNTDTELLEPIGPVVNWLESHGSYGALTINMVDGDQIPRACTGRFPNPLRLALLRRMLVAPAQYQTGGTYDVDWVQGSFLLMRSDLWRKLEGLDTQYFMYAEDVDICKRVWNAGFKCVYIAGAKYLHWGGFSPTRFPNQVRGLARYVDKHMGPAQGNICRAILFAGCLGRVVLYKLRSLIWNRPADRTRAEGSWRAFLALNE
jgi:N-acetylglucosaminyl-diphospho-decaprenol L-rhamnosyltransferase